MNTSSKGPCILLTWVSENPYHEPSMPPWPQETKTSNISNESKCCVKVYAYETFIYNTDVSHFFEWNGSYGNAAFKLKKFFSVKIPI